MFNLILKTEALIVDGKCYRCVAIARVGLEYE